MRLDRIERIGLRHMVGQNAAIKLEGGVHVAFDEARVDRCAFGVDLSRSAEAGADLRVGTECKDAAAGNGDRAVLDVATLIVHRDEIAVADYKVRGGEIASVKWRCHLASPSGWQPLGKTLVHNQYNRQRGLQRSALEDGG